LLLAEIENTQKLCKAEMLTNEKLVGIHNRMEKDYNELTASHRKNQLKFQHLQAEFFTATRMHSASQQDLMCCQLVRIF